MAFIEWSLDRSKIKHGLGRDWDNVRGKDNGAGVHGTKSKAGVVTLIRVKAGRKKAAAAGHSCENRAIVFVLDSAPLTGTFISKFLS